jgi:hypothetical protein
MRFYLHASARFLRSLIFTQTLSHSFFRTRSVALPSASLLFFLLNSFCIAVICHCHSSSSLRRHISFTLLDARLSPNCFFSWSRVRHHRLPSALLCAALVSADHSCFAPSSVLALVVVFLWHGHGWSEPFLSGGFFIVFESIPPNSN